MSGRVVDTSARRRLHRPPPIIALAVVIALLAVQPAAARDATLSALQPFVGRVVVIETDRHQQTIARLISANDSAIVAAVGGVETTFRQSEVRSVAADVNSMRIGLTIGTGVGVAAAILGAQGLSCSDCSGTVAAGAAFSLAAFAGLGAFIGKHHHRRITVYRRP